MAILRRWFPSGIKREHGEAASADAVAAPATVSGEPRATHATGKPGRRRKAKTREPGDLPSPWSNAGASDGVYRWEVNGCPGVAASAGPAFLLAWPFDGEAGMRAFFGAIAVIGIFGASAAAWGQAAGAADSPYLLGDWGGERQKLHDAGIDFQVQEESEIWANLTGGRKQGAVYDGLANARDDRHRPRTARGVGRGRVLRQRVSGPRPRPVGEPGRQRAARQQPRSDARHQALRSVARAAPCSATGSASIGQEGANDEFMISQYATLFVNSSFGFPALTALDLPSGGANYPLATPFARVKYAHDPRNDFACSAPSITATRRRPDRAIRSYATPAAPRFASTTIRSGSPRRSTRPGRARVSSRAPTSSAPGIRHRRSPTGGSTRRACRSPARPAPASRARTRRAMASTASSTR